ncbi:MAG: hypothetical protein AVDCRST_MAG19-4138 [uncultured Thermomicrobiales bacterium]|uniref:DUF393 domain-containing protein n=1 Tax=uncultured Thermomicrobiales bacterium TaxID=1645740 RepID=A0A6J4VQC1_9BACT|nr:MAG: hypothetical protein AVDCRST_MAG19-4138 [uncultured Thermomicrobiales bacterium]
MTVVPFQRSGVPAAHGLSVAACEAAAWAVTPAANGVRDRYRGAGAVNAALAVALGVALPIRLYALPGVGRIEDAAYAWVARNRHRLPGEVPYCERYPDECR